MEKELILIIAQLGKASTDSWGEVMQHVIAHEIHHMGQLSVWARELGQTASIRQCHWQRPDYT